MSQRAKISDQLKRGDLKPDLAITNGKVVNVHTQEIYASDVLVSRSRIALISENAKEFIGKQTRVIDAKGSFLVPGLIDTHYHVAGTYLTMTNLAAALLARGTTAIASDFYEYGAVGGPSAIKFGLDEAKKTPLKVLFNAPLLAYVQNNPFSNTKKVSADDLSKMLEWENAVALCEVQPQTLDDPKVRKLIEKTIRLRKTVVGHYVGFDERGIASWQIFGPSSDHESTNSKEAVEKVRCGVRIAIREGSAATDLFNVVRAITEYKLDPRFFMFCTDEIDPVDLENFGHMDYKIRKAVSLGLSPISAIQMATINAAEYFGVNYEIGSLASGKMADILLVRDISDFRPETVIANGKVVAINQEYLGTLVPPKYPKFMRGSVNLKKKISFEDFQIKTSKRAGRARVNVIIAKEGLLISDKKVVTLKVSNGVVLPDPEKDILKVSVIERFGFDEIGNGFIAGFELKSGAIAESFNPIPENIIAVGTNDKDIAFAVDRIPDMQGGFIVASEGKSLAEFKLPILGLMSEKPLKETTEELRLVISAARKLGCKLKSPFLTLMFMGYPLIPTLKITEKGLVDVDQMEFVTVIRETM
jgi:adenine deaminase